ncbi:4Fe-4S dicluster domain-containing protein [Dethiobacter alkaliphilus]|uniref:4Fe-4S dicluster domain-containing protein n=1 Tax=Dethiobacter alkaliphilus TaxID=427926 RepID=UPI002227B7D3|nr:4Fe-4S dicluster domain-containing protein [Dethiobacter alkaliphilus]MCW3490453.1 4Fe-4S dicluster domain-containing protein [Dethiobacter alkaliphilus]
MPGQKENFFVYADPDKCLGCKSCEIACGLEHAKADLITAVLEKYPVQPRNYVVQAGGIKTPVQCRQCEDAPCALVCPTEAIFQQDGMVALDRRACFGCKNCSMVCPFGAIRVKSEAKESGDRRIKRAKALKCDLCIDESGEVSADSCACIQACPTKAISLVDSDVLRKKLMEARVGELAQAFATDK